MNRISVEKIRVVLTALPSYLMVATLVLTVVSTELVPLLPGGAAAQVGGWITTALLVIAALVKTIARLTPVAPDEVGLLPQGQLPPPAPGAVRFDPGRASAELVLSMCAVILIASAVLIIARVA